MKEFLAHYFLPRHTNRYRAKLLHHTSLFIFIGLLFLSNYAISHIQTEYKTVLGVSSSITAQELLVLTNLKREERGLPALVMSAELSQAASLKAADMFAKNYWAHIAPDGTTPWFFIRSSGYEYIHAGENLARGFSTSGDVVNAWMESPGHRDNMLSSNYKEIGFAISSGNLTGDETVLVVEMFGNRQAAGQSVAQVETNSVPLPTPTTVQIISQIPTPTTPLPIPTSTPTPLPAPLVPETVEPTPLTQVAAAFNQPLINSVSLQRNIVVIVLVILLVILILDIIIVERKKLSRILSHNLDHVIFFATLLIIAIIISRGGIL